MDGFVRFMQGSGGRGLRAAMGLALIGAGLVVTRGVATVVPVIIGVVPLVAGPGGNCLLAPLAGCTLTGQPHAHA